MGSEPITKLYSNCLVIALIIGTAFILLSIVGCVSLVL